MRLFVLVFIAVCYGLNAQVSLEESLNNLDEYISYVQDEKLFVHTDKLNYIPGDTIWFKAYLLDGITLRPGTASSVVHLELFSPSDTLVKALKLYSGASGLVAGDIVLREDIEIGEYKLRAYTNHMRNQDNETFFTSHLHIWDPLETSTTVFLAEESLGMPAGSTNTSLKPQLRIFPEGGEMVNGLKSRLALELSNIDIDRYNVSANLMHAVGEIIAPIRFYDRGLSLVEYTPTGAEGDYIELSVNGIYYSYDLPRAREEGYVLSLTTRPGQLIVKVQESSSQVNSKAFLIAHLRGQVIWSSEVKFTGSQYVGILPTESLGSGVVHLTLFDDSMRPQCERLAFIYNDAHEIDMTTSAEVYLKQQEFTLRLDREAVTNRDTSDLSCSVSIFKIDNAQAGSSTQNICSALLLNSDLRGEIENPDWFFESGLDFKKAYLLDILMMTRGWRRFTWKDVNSRRRRALDYNFEKGIMVEGWTGGVLSTDKAVRSKVVCSFMDQAFYEQETETDENGRFSFGPFVCYDTIKTFLQARRLLSKKELAKLEGKRNVLIHREERERAPFTNESEGTKESKFYISESFKDEERTAYYRMSEYKDMMKVDMDALVVSAKKKTKNDSLNDIANRLSVYGEPSARYVPGENDYQSGTVFDMLRRVAGVQVSGTAPSQSARIRGVSSINADQTPLYLINGMVTDEATVNRVSSYEVLFIDVLKDGRAAIFGLRGSNGVIAIYTGPRDPSSYERKPGIINFELEGFYTEREFYSPKRSYEYQSAGLPDLRTTLYWNPELILKAKTTEDIRMFCSDRTGTFVAELNGISTQGTPVYARKIFRVK